MATAPTQGIMALPENQGMQAPQLSMSDSYDAVREALQIARPDVGMEMDETFAEIRPMLDELSDEQLSLLIEAIQALYNDPENYARNVAELVRGRFIESAEELPPEYDEQFISTLLMLLIDNQRARMGAASAPPLTPEMAPPQQFARGGIAEAARTLASQGRNGDTMLAHITPEEARLLKALGGSGTINPRTGLPEFWPLLSRKRGIGKLVTKALSSPIGRILGTIALTMALGPAGLNLGLSAGMTAAVASGGVTALAGGDLKSVLTSAAVGFIGAPGGPVSQYIGKYTASLGVTNPIVNQALTGMVTGTAGGVISGQGLKDAIRSGLVEGAIAGGTALVSGAPKADVDKAAMTAAADGTVNGPKLQPLDAESQTALDDFLGTNKPPTSGTGAQRGQPVTLSVDDAINSGKLVPNQQYIGPDGLVREYRGVDASGRYVFDGGVGDPIVRSAADANRAAFTNTAKPGVGSGVTNAQMASQGVSSGVTVPSANAVGTKNVGIFGTPEAQQTIYNQGASIREAAARAAESGIPDIPSSVGTPTAAATGPYKQPGVMDSFGEMGSGAKKFMTGDFSEGASQMYKGAGDLFAPGPSAEQRTAMIDDFMAKNPGKSVGDAIKYVDEISPGFARTYGPTAVAGIGALGLAGGFSPDEPPPDSMKDKLYGTPGLDLINANPSQYLIQGLPGVNYNAQGNIIGSQRYSSPYTMQDIRVPSSYADGGIAALMQGGYPRRVGQISGPGTEKSDSIPAMLSDGEFVMTAKAVRGAGGGSRREGAKRMYALMHQLERNAARG
jgi:hypothetical protein